MNTIRKYLTRFLARHCGGPHNVGWERHERIDGMTGAVITSFSRYSLLNEMCVMGTLTVTGETVTISVGGELIGNLEQYSLRIRFGIAPMMTIRGLTVPQTQVEEPWNPLPMLPMKLTYLRIEDPEVFHHLAGASQSFRIELPLAESGLQILEFPAVTPFK